MERRLSPSKIAKHNWQRKPMKNQIQLTKGSSSASHLNSSFRVPHWFLLDSKYVQLAKYLQPLWSRPCWFQHVRDGLWNKIVLRLFPVEVSLLFEKRCSPVFCDLAVRNKHLLMKSSFLVLFLRVAQWFKLSEVCQSEALWGCLNLFQQRDRLEGCCMDHSDNRQSNSDHCVQQIGSMFVSMWH